MLVSAYADSQPWLFLEMASDNTDNHGANYDGWSRFWQESYEWSDPTETDNEDAAHTWEAHYMAIANANEVLNCRMAEYTKAVLDGRPNFHVSLIVDVSPNCDCHCENDAPILPNIGMFASFDPLALDQACVDACLKQTPLPNSQLTDAMAKEGFCDHHDHFENTTPNAEYKTCLEHAEKIGIGSRAYELIVMK